MKFPHIFRAALAIAVVVAMAGIVHAADKDKKKTDTAIFAGGCFWCMESPYDFIKGVKSTTPGYTGGTTKNPTYHQVSTGTTGHAESMLVEFDPSQVSYETLLQVYWHNIDPQQSNGQFCDYGTQYRPEIFYNSEAQRTAAEASKKEMEKRFGSVAVKVTAATTFYPAEEYHQDYCTKNADAYHEYREGCGRDRRLKEIWGDEAGVAQAKMKSK
jgi:peptide-methionine (S)-S-oxide reductase